MLQKTYYDAWNYIFRMCNTYDRYGWFDCRCFKSILIAFHVFRQLKAYFSIRAIQMCTNMFKALVFTHRLLTMTDLLGLSNIFFCMLSFIHQFGSCGIERQLLTYENNIYLLFIINILARFF